MYPNFVIPQRVRQQDSWSYSRTDLKETNLLPAGVVGDSVASNVTQRDRQTNGRTDKDGKAGRKKKKAT